MTSNATIEAGSLMRVVNTNVTSATLAATIAATRISALAPRAPLRVQRMLRLCA